jgi:hypothetical protein
LQKRFAKVTLCSSKETVITVEKETIRGHGNCIEICERLAIQLPVQKKRSLFWEKRDSFVYSKCALID